MTGLVINLLGPPSGVLPAAGSKALSSKDMGLLAYLVLEPGPHRRDELAALLWSESDDEHARASLRQALKRLRAQLGETLLATRSSVQLAGGVACDVLAFQRASSAEPETAARYDVNSFLSGLVVRHAPVFEEWLDTTRLRLRRQYEDLVTGLARAAMLRWQWREAGEWAGYGLGSNPLSEECARIAVEALYLSGSRRRALALHAEYEARCIRELGMSPGPELRALRDRIMAGPEDGHPTPISAEWFSRMPVIDPPLVGRSDAWDLLMSVWKSLRRGQGRLVVIQGDAGVGKSRLADDFLRWAAAEGATVLRGEGYDPRAGVPYGPVAAALRASLDAPGLAGTDPEWLAEVGRLLPELRRRFPALPTPPEGDATARWRLFEGLAQVVLALAEERPVVFLVDDLQWCDSESCALLHFLARRWAAAPVALVASLTLGEAERAAPAARLSRALCSEDHARVLTLTALSDTDVRQLIRQLGKIHDPRGGARFAARIHAVTKGNPFYIVELLKTLFAQGLLATDPETGAWMAGPEVSLTSGHFPLPPSVREAVAARVERLPYQLRDLLTTSAVAAAPCRAELMSLVHGISRLHAAALCDELVERHLLVEEAGAYRCAHPLIADVVRAEATASRRREVHRAIALALMREAAEGRDETGRIAWHAARAGEHALAYRHALLASEECASRYAPEEALMWLDIAATAAADDTQREEVNRRTAGVLDLAGWREPPRRSLPRDSLGAALHAEDIDFRVLMSEAPGQPG